MSLSNRSNSEVTITADAVGSAVVRATSQWDSKNIAECNVNVKVSSTPIRVTSVSLSEIGGKLSCQWKYKNL